MFCAEEFTIFSPLGPVVKIPSETYTLRPHVILPCALSLAPGVNYATQWKGPGHIGLTTNDYYTIAEEAVRLTNGSELPGTKLIMHKLSYQDAGVYTCYGRRLEDPNNPAPSWESAEIDLQLDRELAIEI